MSNLLQRVRADVRGRSSNGLLSAIPRFVDYNYTQKFHKARRGAKGAGHHFEEQVVERLTGQYLGFSSGLAFEFATIYSPKTICIPDGIIFQPEEIIIVEVKLRHTLDAWYQLKYLYGPVVALAFGGRFRVRLLEICKEYNPLDAFPREWEILPGVDGFVETGAKTGVVIWGR